MKLNTLAQNTIVKDKVSGMKGMITHLHILMGNQILYAFQPRGLHPKSGKPVKVQLLVEANFDADTPRQDIEIPVEVLGTNGEDTATGFKGQIIELTIHPNGCVHVSIQPQGVSDDTGGAHEACDFDLRRVKGPAIKAMNEQEIKEDQKKKPSPVGGTSFYVRNEE